MPNQEEQSVAHFGHRLHAGVHEGGADALALMRWRDGNWSERGAVVDAIANGYAHQAVGGVTHDFIIEQGDLREDQRIGIAQYVDELRFRGATESVRCYRVDFLNVCGMLGPNIEMQC